VTDVVEHAVELLPDPSRLIEGLRDTGYEFNTALADIIDNSIAADARKVDVVIEMTFDGEVSVTVADDGCGMDAEGLLNAMRYGSSQRDDPGSLGKFGMGLKTASTAFCRRLSLVSRLGAGAEARKVVWDLDHVAATRRWEVLKSAATPDEVALLDETAAQASGTLVVWSKVDRLFRTAYKNPSGAAVQNAFQKVVSGFTNHAAMVFQRYLDAEFDSARTVELVVNGERIEPWDPFAADGASVETVADTEPVVDMPDGSEVTFSARACVLPRKDELTDEAWTAARLGGANQGFYIYRENRLIHSGDWLGMFARDPHLTLLRVNFSFDHRLDDAFRVDIKKSKIILNEALADWFKDTFLTAPRRAANERYRKGDRSRAVEAGKNAHHVSNVAIGKKEKEVSEATVTSADESTNTAQLENPQGTFHIKIPVVKPENIGEFYVQPVESIDDGLLWEPCIIDGHSAVRINTGHPYYQKVYLPNLMSGVTVQGMDSLVWALSQAELATWNESVQVHLTEFRYKVSSILRTLVRDLAEPDFEQLLVADDLS